MAAISRVQRTGPAVAAVGPLAEASQFPQVYIFQLFPRRGGDAGASATAHCRWPMLASRRDDQCSARAALWRVGKWVDYPEAVHGRIRVEILCVESINPVFHTRRENQRVPE